jgi:hypothetical protein
MFELSMVPFNEKHDPFEIDEYIHHYHQQSQELFTYINYSHSFSNASLLGWLREMDEEERGDYGSSAYHPSQNYSVDEFAY